jgi:hypothetical protein
VSATSIALVSRVHSLVSATSSRGKTEARVSSMSRCSAVRAASHLSRLDSRFVRHASSRSSLSSSRASCSCCFYSNSSTAYSYSSMARTCTSSSSACLMVPLAQASAEAYSSLASASIHRESQSWLLMAVCSLFISSSLTSWCCCVASTLALSAVVCSLSMGAHNNRRVVH